MYVNLQSDALAIEGCTWQTITSTKALTQTNTARIPKRPTLQEFIVFVHQHNILITRMSRLSRGIIQWSCKAITNSQDIFK